MHFPEPMHLGTMRGTEAHCRSTRCPREAPLGTVSKKLHNFLAVKIGDFDSSARYMSQLKSKCRDSEGRDIEIIHTGAKARRPPHIMRRGEMLFDAVVGGDAPVPTLLGTVQ